MGRRMIWFYQREGQHLYYEVRFRQDGPGFELGISYPGGYAAHRDVRHRRRPGDTVRRAAGVAASRGLGPARAPRALSQPRPARRGRPAARLLSGSFSKKKRVTRLRSAPIESHVLIAVRRREPLSKPLRVPGAQRAQLVDHPAIAPARRAIVARRVALVVLRRDVAEALGLALALAQQQIDVVEQELPALLHRDDARRAARERSSACARIHGIAQHAAADQHAADGGGSAAARWPARPR